MNATFAGNEATAGGTFHRGEVGSGGGITIVNSIVASGPRGALCDTSIVDGGHNLFADASCSGASPVVDLHLDPRGLADNGGPTQTIALLPGSPAVDAGDAAVCAATPVDGVDQRGAARPDGLACDIGAFEGVLLPPTTTTTTTLPPAGCDDVVTAAATRCRLVELRNAIGTDVPAGVLQRKLDKLVGGAIDKLDASEALRASGKKKPVRAKLQKAIKSLGRARKTLKSRAAAKALAADRRDELGITASRLQGDLRTLKKS
jgi:hypothetical protein